MRTPPRIGCSAVFILAISSWNLVVSAESVHVSIENRLGNGRSMNIHCQSEDTDLGKQSVTDRNEFGWDFNPNIWGTTLFFCALGWENVQKYHFNAYSYARDSNRCNSGCSWLISAEGMYGFNEHTGFWEFMYDWSS